ncbi:uncharacterized protein LOC119450999 [Dermacentor silvarum]|uniref:uncharacterized protein LOC119450999 n=1 Tax=Dermacentor silvarum TaxID=543639 RepID=UPI001897568C|nr:uncharacterized protein LOC119450999 [Dermacentor silvarum]
MAQVGMVAMWLFLILAVTGLGAAPTAVGAQDQDAADNRQGEPAARTVIVAGSAGVPLSVNSALAPASRQEYGAVQPAGSYGLLPRSRLRRNAHRRRRRLDNPRYYYPNGDYSSDTEVGWDNYRRRAVRESAEVGRRPDSYQVSYAAPLESDAAIASAERFKVDEGHREPEQEYAAGGYDYRTGYQRQGYQKQRRSAAAVPAPRRNAKQWGSWQSDYGGGHMQQSWNERYPQYDYGEPAIAYARKEPSKFYVREESASGVADPGSSAQSSYAAEVAGQDGVVERAGDVPAVAAAAIPQ